MKKLLIALSFFPFFITSLMAASQYDGIWEIKGLHVIHVNPPDATIDPLHSILPPGVIFPGEALPLENFLLISKFGNSGIILIAQRGGAVIPGLFSMKDKELNAEIPLFFGPTIPERNRNFIRITFTDSKTAIYQRTYIAFKIPVDPQTQRPLIEGNLTFTIEGNLHKVMEPFDYVYDGIWEIKDLHITEMKPPPSPIPGRSFPLDFISAVDFFGPIENFLLISKFGNSGIILIAQRGGYVVPGLFNMKGKELNAGIPLFFGLTFDRFQHTIGIIFNDTKTATYKRTYQDISQPLPDPITGKPGEGHPIFTVEGTLHKVVEPFD